MFVDVFFWQPKCNWLFTKLRRKIHSFLFLWGRDRPLCHLSTMSSSYSICNKEINSSNTALEHLSLFTWRFLSITEYSASRFWLKVKLGFTLKEGLSRPKNQKFFVRNNPANIAFPFSLIVNKRDNKKLKKILNFKRELNGHFSNM